MAPPGDNIQLADILDASTNGILVADSNGNVVYVNKLVLSYFKTTADTCVGMPVGDLIPMISRDVEQCIRSGEAITGRRLNGKIDRFVANISPIVKQSEVVGAMVSVKKMEEYKRLAETLDAYKSQNKLFQAIFNASSDGLWIVDAEGVIVAWNPAAEFITGFKAEEMVGKRFTELEDLGIQQDDVHYIMEAIDTKRRVSTFNIHPRSNKQVLGNATPVLDDDDNVIWVVGNEHDLSELNELRKDLDNAFKLTEKAKEELSGLNLSELKGRQIVAESKGMLQALQLAVKLAKIDASHILITGESGTGKGFLSKFIHNKSAHASKPFIQINCAAVPENLLEAELFGYEKGAFTGAGEKGKAGLIELAQGGTLFLDEIGDMPLPLQAKLLKYLDDHEVMRLGAVKPQKIDCAIISATNQNLENLVEQKRFRQDLYFRLNNFQIHIPPLRERSEDIFELAQFYIQKYNKQYKLRKRVSAQGVETLQSYPFPGNVRELESICKQAVLMSAETLLDGYLAEKLQVVCSPLSLSAPQPAGDSPPLGESTPGPQDPVASIAAWIAKTLKAQPPAGVERTGSDPEAVHPLLTQVVKKAIELGRMIYAETCRQFSEHPAGGQPVQTFQAPQAPQAPQSPISPPVDHGKKPEEVVNLTEALDTREREIFLRAMAHCSTIRELAEYLQTSPATALRKLKKHGLNL